MQASLLFADQFYRALLTGYSVSDAFEQGLARLQDSFPEEKAKYVLTGKSTSHSEVLFPIASPLPSDMPASGALVDETPRLPFSNCNEVTSFFIGRKIEVFHAYKSLVNKNRIVNLVGPQGIGKSQIALACAAYCRERYVFDAILHWELAEDSSLSETDCFEKLHRVFDLYQINSTSSFHMDTSMLNILDKWAGKSILCIVDGIVCGVSVSESNFVKKFLISAVKKTKSIHFLTNCRDDLNISHPVRVIPVGPLKDIFSAELFTYRCARTLTRGELTQCETEQISDNPLVSFSKTEIIKKLLGNPLIIERVAAMATVRNLLLHRTEFTMNIIPGICGEIEPLCDLPDPPVPLSRALSEQAPMRSEILRRTASDWQQTSPIVHKVCNTSPSHSPSQGFLTVSEFERELIDIYHTFLGDTRPITGEDILFLKRKLNWDFQKPLPVAVHQNFLIWYVKILNCFARSELWLKPGCIQGFVNREHAKQILSMLPNTAQYKVILNFISLLPFIVNMIYAVGSFYYRSIRK